MTQLKEKIGHSLGPLTVKLHPEKVREFAQTTGWKGSGIPATFLTCFRELEFKLFANWGLALSRILHAEQEYEYLSPFSSGDELELTTSVVHVIEKKGSKGTLTFVILESQFSKNDTVCARGKTTVVIRGENSGVNA